MTIKVRIDSVFKLMFLLFCTVLFDNFIALFYLVDLFALNVVVCFARFVHVRRPALYAALRQSVRAQALLFV